MLSDSPHKATFPGKKDQLLVISKFVRKGDTSHPVSRREQSSQGYFDNEIQVDKLNALKGVKKINVKPQ